jgi:hypothetical protein
MSQPFPTPDDHNAIRGVILAQLEAFAAGDDERAFSFASDACRERFGDAVAFVEMVSRYYYDVYRARGARFGMLTEQESGTAVQIVRFLGAAGDRAGGAIYQLCRQPPGWRINGCVSAPWLSEEAP